VFKNGQKSHFFPFFSRGVFGGVKFCGITDSEKNGQSPGGIAFFLGFLFDENAYRVIG